MSIMGIWEYYNRFSIVIEQKLRLSLGEGHTPLEEYSIEGNTFYTKREDLNPTGSHKDRGLAFQISAHLAEEKTNFVISSSGNSSICAISLLLGTPYKLEVFLSPYISENKIQRIEYALSSPIVAGEDSIIDNVSLYFSKRAVSDAFKKAKEPGKVLLRGSTDQYALPGYSTIAYELEEQLIEISDIFIPTSSGTTAVGIYKGFKSKPRMHICQSTAVNTLVRNHVPDFEQTEESIADSIVDKVGHRRDEVESILMRDGAGWVVSDEQINRYKIEMESLGILCSNEGILAYSAYREALKKGMKMTRPVILITGKK